MASTETYQCKTCGSPFVARTADRKRGWAQFCSKSCKAIRQTQITGRGRPAHDHCDCDRGLIFEAESPHGQWEKPQ